MSKIDIFLTSLSCAMVVIFFVTLGLPPGHSAPFNYAWYTQYSEAVSWLNPIPRYLPGLLSGFGGQDFFFYAPLPFWFIAVFVHPFCLGCSPSTEFVLGSSLVFVASAFAMFIFLRCFFSVRSSALGALVYSFLPYHLLIDWFERQAVGEFTAFAFIPLIALGTERLRNKEKGAWILAVGVAGVALSHLPTALIAAHAFSIVFVVFSLLAPGSFLEKIWLFVKLIWFSFIGLAIASFYWIPAVMLLNTVSPGVLYDPYFNASRWLFSVEFGQPNVDFSVRILTSFFACFPLILASLPYLRGAVTGWVIVLTIFAVFMNTALSEEIWREWVINRVQFPWRMMTLIDFSAAVAAATLAERAVGKFRQISFSAVLAVAAVPISLLASITEFTQNEILPEQRYSNSFAAAEYLSPEMTESVRNWLGLSQMTYADKEAMVGAVAEMRNEFNKEMPSGVRFVRSARSFTVIAPIDADIVSLPVQFWFLWRARTESGRVLEVRPNVTFGTLDVIAPAEGFQGEAIVIWLPMHGSEILGYTISSMALLLLIALKIRSRKAAAV